MNNKFYIYNNSPATALQGFWTADKFIKSEGKTTMEFAFAKEFDSYEEAKKWVSRGKRIGIIFERKDI